MAMRDSSSSRRAGLLSRNSMNYSFDLSNLGRADRKALYLLFARPERPRHCPSLIPAGDRYNSRGQRPRKTRPPQGPTLKGSNPAGVTPVLRPAAVRALGVTRRIFRSKLSQGIRFNLHASTDSVLWTFRKKPAQSLQARPTVGTIVEGEIHLGFSVGINQCELMRCPAARSFCGRRVAIQPHLAVLAGREGLSFGMLVPFQLALANPAPRG